MRPALRQILLGSIPGWVSAKYGSLAPFVTFAAHDDARLYWAKGYGNLPESACFSNTRTGTRWYQNASGVYVSAPSNQTLVMPDGSGAPLLQSITNKCTNYNANPTDLTNMAKGGDAAAVLSVVDDTATLLASGLQNIVTSGKVYKLDNSLGTIAAYAYSSGGTGNTNTHVSSAFAYKVGSPLVSISGTGSWSGVVVVTSTTNYQRYGVAGTPGSTSDRLQITANAGGVVYFILNSLVENSFDIPSPVVTAGASASVGADIRQLIGPALAAALAAKGAYVETNGVAGGTGPSMLRWSNVAGNGMFFGGTNKTSIYNGTTQVDATIGGSGIWSGITKSAFKFDAASFGAVANGGTPSYSATSWGSVTYPAYHGNRAAGDRALNGLARKFAFLSVDPTTTAGLTS